MKLEDIAKIAGVSKASVSLALSGKPGVSKEKREKILSIARDSGYIPRSMVKADELYSSQKIIRFVACVNSGIVSEQFQMQPFFMELIRSIEVICRQHSYSVLFSSVKMDNPVEDVLKLERAQPSQGLLILGTNMTRGLIDQCVAQFNNIVILDTLFNHIQADFVSINNYQGAFLAAQFLINQGHTKIGYVESSSRMCNFDTRKQGFMDALSEHGLTCLSQWQFAVAPSIVDAYSEFKETLANGHHELPTALFCECDYIAIGIMKSLRELGYDVPNDISIMGFDNISEATVVTPELTTVHVDKTQMGSLAVELLMQSIEGATKSSVKVCVDTRIVQRNSTKQIV